MLEKYGIASCVVNVRNRELCGQRDMQLKVTCACREWNQAYAQLEMERGFCSLGGAEKYSPELVQRRALESPATAARVALRGGEMLWRLGLFACSLLADNLAGLSEEGDRVRLRARQLRCAAHLLCMSRESLVLQRSPLHAVASGPLACSLLANKSTYSETGQLCASVRTGKCAWALAGQGGLLRRVSACLVLLLQIVGARDAAG